MKLFVRFREYINAHRKLIVTVTLLVTAVAVVWYILKHPEVIATLGNISWILLLEIILCDFIAAAGLIITLIYSVRLFNKHIGPGEAFLLNSYSSIANFFGPGQSGTGVRAVYLKTKHEVRVRDFAVASLIYYAIYSLISIVMLFAGAGKYIIMLGAALVTIVISWLVIVRYRHGKSFASITNPMAIAGIAIGTILQIAAISTIYYLEVHAVWPQVSVAQAVSYTGSANMSLFASLTPGAIGIREAFLLATQTLHHIDTATIVAAGVIDRATYLLFLGLLGILILVVHGKRTLGIKLR